MHGRTRRALLTRLAGGIAAFAGCTSPSSDGPGGTDTSSGTPTSSASPTMDDGSGPGLADLDEDATDGSEVWRADAGGPVGSLGVAGDALVVRSGKGRDRLLGLDLANGSKLWSFEAEEDLTRPALGDGVVAVGSESGMVRLLGP